MNIAPNLDHADWIQVKGQIIGVFGTLSKAAAACECHPNSFRKGANCPGIMKRLSAEMKKVQASRKKSVDRATAHVS